MTTTLIALHGFTQNGAQMRDALAPLTSALPPSLRIEYPDGPVVCADSSVQYLSKLLGGLEWNGPHLAWFDATDDGREYRGFADSEARLHEIAQRERSKGQRVGLLGFSQGAVMTACVAALAAHGRFPVVDFAILIAGRPPRADVITPLLGAPLAVPSLHVSGDNDALAKDMAEPLAALFDATSRELVTFPGAHVMPTRGPGAEAIVAFIERQVRSARDA